MSNAARPLHRISQHHGRNYRGDVGGWMVRKAARYEKRFHADALSQMGLQKSSLTSLIISSVSASPLQTIFGDTISFHSVIKKKKTIFCRCDLSCSLA